MKKVISVLLCLLMLTALLPLNVFAEVTETSGSYKNVMTWEYDKDSKTLTVNCEGPLDLPYEDKYYDHYEFGPIFSCRAYPWNINGINSEAQHLVLKGNITAIGTNTFRNFHNLQELTIPDKVTSIGASAFSSCLALEEIDIPSGVKRIEASAFWHCSSLKRVTLHDGLEYIGTEAFSCCDKLEVINIPETVTMTGNNIIGTSFSDALKSLIETQDGFSYIDNVLIAHPINNGSGIIRQGTKFIPEDFFYLTGASSINSIVIPDSVERIGSRAFYGTALTSVTIPKSVKTVSKDAFCQTEITSLTIENGVENIEDGAFSYNYKLKNINMGNSVKIIGKSAFKNAPATSVRLPANLERIDDFAFSDTKLTSVLIPKNVKWISSTAFDGAPIANVGVDKNNKVYTSVSGVLFSKNRASLVYYPFAKTDKNYIVPSGVKYVYSDFRSGKLETVTLPKTLAGMYRYTGKKLYYFGSQDEWDKLPKATGKDDYRTLDMNAKCCKAKLTKTKYNYDGKTHKPKVKVYDPAGNLLKEKKDYTVTFPKSSKKINIYTVKIKLKGKFKGTYNLTYRIAPQGTDFTKVVQGGGKFTIKWKKQTKNTTGYEIQYSKSSTFAKGTNSIITVKKDKGSKTFSNISVDTPYYLRIRTYKQVGKKRVYSSWGKTKTVKVKSPY